VLEKQGGNVFTGGWNLNERKTLNIHANGGMGRDFEREKDCKENLIKLKREGAIILRRGGMVILGLAEGSLIISYEKSFLRGVGG